MKATNTSDKTSDFSMEVHDFPVVARGLRAPRYIDDIGVGKQGMDTVLSWSEVTTDVFGKPESVASYRIWRGDGRSFGNGGLSLLGTCPAPCTSYTDTNALADATEHFYRVQPVDVDTNVGGLGAELPAWVDLSVGDSAVTPGNVVLSWAPVTLTVAGDPTSVLEYRVYAADAPFSREQVRDGAIPMLTSTTSTSVEISPPVQDRYYSVLVVDTLGNTSPF